MLKMLERQPIGEQGFGAPRTLHAMIEAMRLAFADRAVWAGDDDVVPVPAQGLLDPAYLATRAALIRPELRLPIALPGDPLAYESAARRRRPLAMAPVPAEPERGLNTTHYSVADRWGNIVSVTSTIETSFGSGILVPGYGFLLNNELTDFNLVPSRGATPNNPGTNDAAPFKRPRSSMAPTLLMKDGRPFAAYGSPGGATIINSVLNTTLNLIDHGMTMQQAIDAPRLSVVSPTGAVACEPPRGGGLPGFAPSTLAHLQALGHYADGGGRALGCSATIGSVQGVLIDPQTGAQHGAADTRREGTVIALPRLR
jgi:gamma-glutamyltranspeptidase/glutathione hydrolase